MANWPTIKLKVAIIMTASQSFLRYERLKSFICDVSNVSKVSRVAKVSKVLREKLR